MIIEWLVLIILFIAVIAFSALFSATETSLFSLSKATLTRWRHDHHRGHQLVAQLLEHEPKTLTAILLGNNFVNLLTPIIMAQLLVHSTLSQQIFLYCEKHFNIPSNVLIDWINGILSTLIILTFGEVLPKAVAYNYAISLAPILAYFISGWRKIVDPFFPVLNRLSTYLLKLLKSTEVPQALKHEEYIAYLQIALEFGAFDTKEVDLIHRILSLKDRQIREIMIPRPHIMAVKETLPPQDFLYTLRKYHHRYIPVIKEDIEEIVGILDVKTFLRKVALQEIEVKDYPLYLTPPFYLPEHTSIVVAIENMSRQRKEIAIVINEYGGIEGILSIEDILEEVVGPITDEFDPPESKIVTISPNLYRVSGYYLLEDLRRELGCSFQPSESLTIGGYLCEKLGRIPQRGDTWAENGWSYSVGNVNQVKVLEVDIQKIFEYPQEYNTDIASSDQ